MKYLLGPLLLVAAVLFVLQAGLLVLQLLLSWVGQNAVILFWGLTFILGGVWYVKWKRPFSNDNSAEIIRKGEIGERIVAAILQRHGVEAVHDYYEEKEGGGLTQIDHLAKFPDSIWVIETKYYSGKIENKYGKLKIGKENILNPCKQNKIHVDSLIYKFPGIQFKNVCVFAGDAVVEPVLPYYSYYIDEFEGNIVDSKLLNENNYVQEVWDHIKILDVQQNKEKLSIKHIKYLNRKKRFKFPPGSREFIYFSLSLFLSLFLSFKEISAGPSSPSNSVYQVKDLPPNLGNLIDRSDWRFISKIIEKEIDEENSETLRWVNPGNDHLGYVTMVAVETKYPFCRQFRITRDKEYSPFTGHKTFCRG